MKRLILAVVVLYLVGCNGETPRKTDEQIAQEEALTIAGGRGFANFQLELRCVDGVQYYFHQQHHSAYFAPVVDKTTLLFKPCGIP